MTVKTLKEGEWAYPALSGYELECCDCGLTHKLDFIVLRTGGTKAIVNGVEIAFRAYRVEKKKKKKKKLTSGKKNA